MGVSILNQPGSLIKSLMSSRLLMASANARSTSDSNSTASMLLSTSIMLINAPVISSASNSSISYSCPLMVERYAHVAPDHLAQAAARLESVGVGYDLATVSLTGGEKH